MNIKKWIKYKYARNAHQVTKALLIKRNNGNITYIRLKDGYVSGWGLQKIGEEWDNEKVWEEQKWKEKTVDEFLEFIKESEFNKYYDRIHSLVQQNFEKII